MSLLQRLASSTERQRDIGLLLLRAWFGLVMAFGHGVPKATDLAKFVEGVTKMGMPAFMAYPAVGAELLGGLMLAVGLLTRLAALSVVGTMLVAAFVVHAADPFMKKEFALAYGVVALVLLVTGAGRFSLDQKLFAKTDETR